MMGIELEEKRRREGGEEMIGQCERLGAELSEKGLSGRKCATEWHEGEYHYNNKFDIFITCYFRTEKYK